MTPRVIKILIRISIINFLLILIVSSTLAYQSLFETSPAVSPQPSAHATQTTVSPKTLSQPTPKPVAQATPEETVLSPSTQSESDPFIQITSHNTSADCWIIYGQHVYNITAYFGSHPGGDGALAKYCGKDATAAFNTKDKNPPSAHSAAAEQLLSTFLIK